MSGVIKCWKDFFSHCSLPGLLQDKRLLGLGLCHLLRGCTADAGSALQQAGPGPINDLAPDKYEMYVVWPPVILLVRAHLIIGRHKLHSISEVLYLAPQGECRQKQKRRWIPISRTGTMATHLVLQGMKISCLNLRQIWFYSPVSRRRELTRHMSSSREAVQGKSSRSHNSLGVNSRWKSAMHWI